MMFPCQNPSRQGRARALVVLLLLLACAPRLQAQPATLHLLNGDRLTGRILTRTPETVTLETQFGRLEIPISQIAREDPALVPAPDAPPPPAPAQPAPPPEPPTAALKKLADQYRAGELSAATYHQRRESLLRNARSQGLPATALAEEPRPVPRPAAAAPQPKAAAPKKRWAGEANVGTDLSFGTKDVQLFHGRLKGTYAESKFRNAVDYMFTYGETDGELSANRMEGSMKTDWGITPRFYVYNLGGGGYDEIRKIDLRYELGPGVGYELIRAKKFQSSFESGANYQVEERATSDNVERFYYRLASITAWQITPRLTWDEKFEFFPRVEDVTEYRFRLETNLRYTLMGNVALIVTLLDQYDTLPARRVDRNDLQIRSSIGVKF